MVSIKEKIKEYEKKIVSLSAGESIIERDPEDVPELTPEVEYFGS